MSESATSNDLLVRPVKGARVRPGLLAWAWDLAAATPGLPSIAGLLVVVAAVSVWALSLSTIDLNAMNDFGLISVLPHMMLVAFVAVIASFCICLQSRRVTGPVLLVHLVALIVMLYGIPPLVEEVPRFAVTWRHIGVTEAIVRTQEVDPTIDAYFNWPGFFTLSAFAGDISGVDPAALAPWTPVFFSLLYLGPLFVLLREATDDRRVIWLAMLIFYVANWIGQDYFSPQGLEYFLYLVALAMIVRWFRKTPDSRAGVQRTASRLARRLRPAIERESEGRHGRTRVRPSPAQSAGVMAILIAVLATIVASHQLTPFAVLIAVTALVVFKRCSATRLPLMIAVLIGTWSAFMAVAYFKGHLASLTSNVGAVEQNVQTSVGGRLHGSPDHLLVLYARLAMTAAVWGLAFLGAIRAYRHHRFSFTYALLACSPFALMALQPYGGEILLRTYLFSLPFIALFAALLFYAGRAAASRSWITTALVGVATSTLMVGFLVTRYGNERMDYFTPQELSAVRYATKTARPGSVLLATTSSLPWKLERYEQFHYKVLSDSPGWSRIDPVRPDVNALVREVEVTLRHPAQDGYFLITRSQEAQLEMEGWAPRFLAQFKLALASSPNLRVAYTNRDASVFTPKTTPATRRRLAQ